MNIIAFAATNSTQSINKKLVTYAVSLLPKIQAQILDLNDYPLPLFSEDIEKQQGQPQLATHFYNQIQTCDGVIISFAEHNGNFSAAYKNLFDWCSRIDKKVYKDKPVVLLATSPGGRGGKGVLTIAEQSMPFFGGNVKATFSLPNFYQNFDSKTQAISNQQYNDQLKVAVAKILT